MPFRPWRRYRQSRTALARGHRSQPRTRQSSLFFGAGYALPLLQYALTELFEHRDDDRLTIAAYREIGGIAGALSGTFAAVAVLMAPPEALKK